MGNAEVCGNRFHASRISFHILGGLAQLARAPALQAGGQRFESVILHTRRKKQRERSIFTFLPFYFFTFFRSLTY